MVKGTLELSARSKLINPRHIQTSALCREETQIYQWVAHSDGSHDEGAPLPPNIASFTDKSVRKHATHDLNFIKHEYVRKIQKNWLGAGSSSLPIEGAYRNESLRSGILEVVVQADR
jgi:hypothetical protein